MQLSPFFNWQNQDHSCYLLSCSRMSLWYYLHRLFTFHSYRGKFLSGPEHDLKFIPYSLNCIKASTGWHFQPFQFKKTSWSDQFSCLFWSNKPDKPTVKIQGPAHTAVPRESIKQEMVHQEISVTLLDDVLHTAGIDSLQICVEQNMRWIWGNGTIGTSFWSDTIVLCRPNGFIL